ncbi:MAG TPA: hypothetical protein DIT97_04805 [Gimesia maris]|uniref:Uncharacterized protein n=1 Tax=Gimesia maris TaxID=122 RepID=A0A3D3R0M8_9PLAN|nr:hypothetical protein [Gimesia maris]|tara:strand:+ start:36952 stop:37641 length:690 start_codon:yes stop_codon:yes gene_type:complete
MSFNYRVINEDGKKYTERIYSHDEFIYRVNQGHEEATSKVLISGYSRAFTFEELNRVPPRKDSECYVETENGKQGPYLPMQIRNMCLDGSLALNTIVSWEEGRARVDELANNPLFFCYASSEGQEWTYCPYRFMGNLGGLFLGISIGLAFHIHPMVTAGLTIGILFLGHVLGAIGDHLEYLNRQFLGYRASRQVPIRPLLTCRRAAELKSAIGARYARQRKAELEPQVS